METPVVTLPSLKDHTEYAACVANLEKLNADLAQAKREEQHHSGAVRPGADSHASDDVDKAVDRFFKDEQRAREASVRAGIRAEAIERAIKREKARLPELFRQAVEMVGRAASEQHSEVVTRLFEHRRQVADLWALQLAICTKLRSEINNPRAPGYLGHDDGQRFAWPPPMVQIFGHPQLEMEAVSAGGAQFKSQVHEPLKKEASGVITRLKEALGWRNQ